MSGVKYYSNGREVTREQFTTRPRDDWMSSPPMTANTYTEHDPLISDGCGVMKAQVKEAREAIRHYGIQGAAVLDNGQMRFTSRRARKKWLSIRELHDRDGSYGD